MNVILEQSGTIFTIEPPPPPKDEISLFIYVLMGLAVGLCAVYCLWRRYGSVKGRAIRRINTLSNTLSSLPTDEETLYLHHQQLAYEISSILRKALHLPRITATTPFPAKLQNYTERWHTFIKTLDQARYSGLLLKLEAQQRLLSDARFFIKRWP